MSTTAEKILSYAARLPEGATVSAKALLHLGERAAVDQALSRLVKRGGLLRVGRGVYTCPVKNRFGERPPAPETVIEAIARHTGEIVSASGAAAANKLGLTTQNPVKSVYLTSGPSRQLRLGEQTLELRHAPAWQLRAPTARSGDALRALAWIGPVAAKEKIGTLRAHLSKEEQAELSTFRASAPTWLAKELSVFATYG